MWRAAQVARGQREEVAELERALCIVGREAATPHLGGGAREFHLLNQSRLRFPLKLLVVAFPVRQAARQCCY